MTNMFRLLLVAASFTLPILSHAVTYEIDSQKVEVPEPAGFISLKIADEKNLNAFYIKNDPILVDFYCNVGEPSNNGACNHPRTLSIQSPKEFIGKEIDAKTYATIKEGTRKHLKEECGTCMEKQRSVPGVKDVEFAGIFADTDQYMGYSHIYTYADHKSVESIISLLVKGKFLIFHARSNLQGKEDIAWTQELLIKWVQQVINANH